MGRGGAALGPWSLFLRMILEAFFLDFEVIWGGFWRLKWRPILIFWRFVFYALFDCILVSTFYRILEGGYLKNSNFTKEKQGFSQNQRFSTMSKKTQI